VEEYPVEIFGEDEANNGISSCFNEFSWGEHKYAAKGIGGPGFRAMIAVQANR